LATSLAGVPGVDFEDASTGTLSLALADPHKLPPSRIPNAFIQTSFAAGSIGQILPRRFVLFRFGSSAHVGRFQIFKADYSIPIDQLARFFVVKIAPLVANVSMELADPSARFSAARRAWLLAGYPLLMLLELRFGTAQMARIVDLLPRGEGGKMQQSQIQTHRFFRGM
jgi:hypothetical protein